MPCDDCSHQENCPPCVNGEGTDLPALRAKVRADVICPKSSVRGGCHQMSHRGVCLLCGHVQVYPMPALGVILDLFYEIDMLRGELAHLREE